LLGVGARADGDGDPLGGVLLAIPYQFDDMRTCWEGIHPMEARAADDFAAVETPEQGLGREATAEEVGREAAEGEAFGF
jgi:hypothetical protein